VVEPGDEDGPIPEGEFVAITVRGSGSWDDEVWRAGQRPGTGLFEGLGPAAARAGAVYAYARDLGEEGSVTVFLPRLPEPR